MTKSYPKTVSENVLRKALYWIPAPYKWTLTETNEEWKIEIQGEAASEAMANLDKRVNDFILREKLDNETGNLRRAIIIKALSDIDKKLDDA